MERRTTLPNVDSDETIERRKDWHPGDETYHLVQCSGCGEWIDMCDLGMAIQHAGELPHGPGIRYP